MNAHNIVLTPINLVSRTLTRNGKKAKNDYIREKEYMENGNIGKWDDSKYNNSNIGEYFAFVHQKENRVEIYKIDNILLSTERPEYWDIPEHNQRNVLYLSPMINQITWDEMKNIIGYKETFLLRGTQRTKKSINLI
jgi:hypothetical protein